MFSMEFFHHDKTNIMTVVSSLAHRPFALLWSGQAVSRLGDSFYNVALVWWVLDKTNSAAAMGTVLIIGRIPLILFLVLGGVVVDRVSRVRLMLASDILRGCLVTLVAALAFTKSLEVWHVYLASALFGFIGAFFTPAYTALVPEITPREYLPSANSLTSLGRETAGIVGPSLAALIASVGSIPLAFGLDAVSFFCSALCLLPLLGLSTSPISNAGTKNIFAETKEGFLVVVESQWLWINIAFFALYNITVGGAFTVVLPLLVKSHLNTGIQGYGFLISMLSLGSILAAVLLGRLTVIRRRGLTSYLANLSNGLLTIFIGWTISIVLVAPIVLLVGMLTTITNLIWINTMQTMIPREKLGRVSSFENLGSELLTPVGFAVDGWMADWFGPTSVFIIGGALVTATSILVLLHPVVRKLD